MQNGDFIADRLFVKFISDICKEQDINLATFSGDWVMELEKEGKTSRILGYKFDLNNGVSAGIVQDKVAAYELMNAHQIPATPHFLIREIGDVDKCLYKGEVVLKPLMGTGGREVAKFKDMLEVKAWLSEQPAGAWAVSPFEEIIKETRIMMLDAKPLLVYEKEPVTLEGLKFFNLGKGATPLNCEPSQSQLELCSTMLSSLGLRLAAIDIITTTNGKEKILEVNDGIMVENYARQSSTNKENAKKVYETLINTIFM